MKHAVEASVLEHEKRLIKSGKPISVVIAELRISGYGMVASVNAIKYLLECSTGDAKSIMHESAAWSEGRVQRERLWGQLDSLAEQIEGDIDGG